MKLYTKNGVVVGSKINSIHTDKGTMINPTDEFLTENGYEIVNVEDNNTDIENTRANAYKNETDILFNRYMIYKELGETEKAEAVKNEWIAARNKIKENNPYKEKTNFEKLQERIKLNKQKRMLKKASINADNTTENTTTSSSETTE